MSYSSPSKAGAILAAVAIGLMGLVVLCVGSWFYTAKSRVQQLHEEVDHMVKKLEPEEASVNQEIEEGTMVIDAGSTATIDDVAHILNKSALGPKRLVLKLEGEVMLDQKNTISKSLTVQDLREFSKDYTFMVPYSKEANYYPLALMLSKEKCVLALNEIHVFVDPDVKPTIVSPNENGALVEEVPKEPNDEEVTREEFKKYSFDFKLEEFPVNKAKKLILLAKEKTKGKPLLLSVLTEGCVSYSTLANVLVELDSMGVAFSMVMVNEQMIADMKGEGPKVESDLLLRLPSSSEKTAPPYIEPMQLQVRSDGSIYIKGASGEELLAGASEDGQHRLPSSMQKLNDIIKLYGSVAGDAAKVEVDADAEVKAQHVIDLLNVLSEHKITKITFTKEKDESKKNEKK